MPTVPSVQQLSVRYLLSTLVFLCYLLLYIRLYITNDLSLPVLERAVPLVQKCRQTILRSYVLRSVSRVRVAPPHCLRSQVSPASPGQQEGVQCIGGGDPDPQVTNSTVSSYAY